MVRRNVGLRVGLPHSATVAQQRPRKKGSWPTAATLPIWCIDFWGEKGSSWLCSELSYYQHRPKHVLRTHWKLRHNERQIETNEFRSILASFLRAEEELSFPSYLDKKTNRSIDTRTLTHTYGAVKGVSKGRVTQLLQQLNFKHFCE